MPQQRKPSLFSSLFHFKRNPANSHDQCSNHSTDLGVNTTLDASMKLENFLLEEYKHTSAFLLQTMQDLTASVNLYFVLVGVLVSGLGLAYNSDIILQPNMVLVFMIFLLVFGVIHFFFFARFISFAIVYHVAVESMNSLRAFYVQKFQSPRYPIGDILSSYTPSSSFYTTFHSPSLFLSFLLALIASLSFAGFAFVGSVLGFHINRAVLFPLPSDIRPYSIGLIVGLAVFLLQILYYRFAQDKSRKPKTK